MVAPARDCREKMARGVGWSNDTTRALIAEWGKTKSKNNLTQLPEINQFMKISLKE